MFKKIFRSLALLILCTLNSNLVSAQEMPPTPVEAVNVELKSLDKKIRAQGEIKAFRSIILQSSIAGKVTSLNIDEGQAVKQGEVLIQLDDRIAKATLQQNQAQHEHSKLVYERVKKLLDKGTGSSAEVEEALANLRFNEANVELAKINLDKTKIKAPFDGILGLKAVDEGDYINPGESLVPLVDIKTILVDFYLPEKYLLQIQEGMQVQLTADSIPGRSFVGNIYAIAPQVDRELRSIHARAQFDNQDYVLKPGIFSRLNIILEIIDKALVLPEEALMYKDNAFYVYKIEDGKAVLTEVQTGVKQGALVQITKGLVAEDQVVLAGQIKLYDGAAVQVIEEQAP